MFLYTENSLRDRKHEALLEKNLDKTALYRQFIRGLTNDIADMTETERQNYEQKVFAKVKSGKRLTSEELGYLRKYNPELYKVAVRVENARKALRTQLANCKSKEEVQDVFAARVQGLQMMKDDMTREAMAAMIDRERCAFQKSRKYVELPAKKEELREKAGKQEKKNCYFAEESEFKRIGIYRQMKFQCELILDRAQEILVL